MDDRGLQNRKRKKLNTLSDSSLLTCLTVVLCPRFLLVELVVHLSLLFDCFSTTPSASSLIQQTHCNNYKLQEWSHPSYISLRETKSSLSDTSSSCSHRLFPPPHLSSLIASSSARTPPTRPRTRPAPATPPPSPHLPPALHSTPHRPP